MNLDRNTARVLSLHRVSSVPSSTERHPWAPNADAASQCRAHFLRAVELGLAGVSPAACQRAPRPRLAPPARYDRVQNARATPPARLGRA